jgi:hypothetical protein
MLDAHLSARHDLYPRCDRRGRADLMERMILEQHTLACCAINVAEV